MHHLRSERRHFIKSSAMGLFAVTGLNFRPGISGSTISGKNDNSLFYRYPSMDDEMVRSVVGASHNDYDKVKEMVSRRPELAGAAWDWGFGDWETALGAASHTGRRDIAELLISHGARPDIFTFTMMGMFNSVKEIIETVLDIQTHRGPHGITLLQHAKNRLNNKTMDATDRENVNKVLAYLEGLGNADIKPKNLEVTEEEKSRLMGAYRFGEGEDEMFEVNKHRLGFLQIARKGFTPRGLNRLDEYSYSPAGAVSVMIVFNLVNGQPRSLTVHEPDPLVVAVKI